MEKNAPIYGVAPLDEQLGSYLAQRRFQTSLLAGFSVVALLMAAVGIYGLIRYSVATRTQEIGLRMALGGEAGDIFRMMIGEGLTLILTGLALGLVGAWWLGRAGSSLLHGVSAGDPLTFATVSLVLTAVAITACYFPARRAMESTRSWHCVRRDPLAYFSAGTFRAFVACSNAYASLMSVASVHAVPKKLTPIGRPATSPAGTVMLG